MVFLFCLHMTCRAAPCFSETCIRPTSTCQLENPCHLQWDVWTKVLDPIKVALSFLQDNRDVLSVWGQIFPPVWLLQSLCWTVDMLGRSFDAGRGSRTALSGWASGCPAVHSFSLRAAKTVKVQWSQIVCLSYSPHHPTPHPPMLLVFVTRPSGHSCGDWSDGSSLIQVKLTEHHF